MACESHPDHRMLPKREAQLVLCRLDCLHGDEERKTCFHQRARVQVTQKIKYREKRNGESG